MFKFSRSEWISTLLQSGIFLMELLFFFGITVMTDAFIQGITGVYTAIAAGMVLSGMIIFEILLRVFRRKREVTERTEKASSLLNALLLSGASALYGYRCFLCTVVICAIIWLSKQFLHKQVLQWLISLAAEICIIYTMTILYSNGTLSFSESMTIAFTASLYMITMMAHEISSEVPGTHKDMTLSVILHTISSGMYIASWGLLVPQLNAVNQAGTDFKRSHWIILSLIAMAAAFTMNYAERIVSKKLNGKQLYITKRISTLITVILLAVFLCIMHKTLGIASILFTAGEAAAMVLLYITHHISSFSTGFVRWLMSHLSIIGIMMMAFTLYNGITLDYSMVIMLMMTLCALVNILASLEDTDIYADTLKESQ